MNLLFISPNYPAHNVKFCEALKKNGINVLGIGDSGDIPGELHNILSDYYVVNDIHDYDSVYRAAAFMISRHGRIDRVVSLIPYWFETVERLCYDYRIPYLEIDPKPLVSLESAVNIVETVPFSNFETVSSGRTFAKKYGYPLLYRANNGWERDSVTETSKGITKRAGNGIALKYKAERYISFEGIAVAGKIAAICGMIYPDLPESAAQSDGLFSFFTFPVEKEQEALCQKLIDAYKISDSVFKLTFINDGEKLLFVRAENTISGVFAIDFMRFCGVDICDLWAKALLGEVPAETVSADRSMVYISRKFDRSYAHTHPEILRKYADVLVNCGLSNEGGNSAAGDYYYYAEVQSSEQADEIIEYIQSDFPAF